LFQGCLDNLKNCIALVAGSAICHWPPAISGAGEETAAQLPGARFVQDCNPKPADAAGHVKVRFVPDLEMATVGLFVLNNR